MDEPGRQVAPPRRAPREPTRRPVGPVPGVLRLASAVGNQASPRTWRSRRRGRGRPPSVPPTPSGAAAGHAGLGGGRPDHPGAVVAAALPVERADIIHHETIHVLQQRCAPADESGEARRRAEALAQWPQGDLLTAEELLAPAPRLLAAPVTGKPASGFTRLFAGDGEVIGEVSVGGVTARDRRSYEKLGIEAPVDPKSQFGTATVSDLQYLACGDKAFPVLAKVAEGLRKVAQRVAAVNESIPKGSGWRVEQVFVANEASRLHVADGAAPDHARAGCLDRAAAESAAHEASHAVFESHTHARPDAGLAPDAFSLRLADLFGRLGGTTTVPIPTEAFTKKPPPLKETARALRSPRAW